VRPDGQLGKHDAWYLRTAVDALERHRRGDQADGTSPIAACDEIERINSELQSGLKAARVEPDLEKRRRLIVEFGPNVGRLLQAMETAAGVSPHEAQLLKIVREKAIGDIINEILELGNWNLSFSESKRAAY
jgi:hypothetical protein